MKTIGHQTLRKIFFESASTRQRKGPILSTIYDKKGRIKSKPPFAGEGYYFWDNNLEAAHWWGSVRYSNSYRIFQMEFILNYDDGSFFDLVGSREHLLLLQKMIEKAKIKLGVACKEWKLSDYITYFRQIEKKHKNGIFPFKYLRFNDARVKKELQMPIVLGNSSPNLNYLLMNPFYIICVFDKLDLNLHTFNHVAQN